MKNNETFPARLSALQAIAPFNRLREAECAVLAEAATPRHFPPQVIVHQGGLPLARLMIVIAGAVRNGAGAELGPVLGLGSLLDGQFLEQLTADPQTGADVLLVNKHTFFTLARECPEVLRGFLELGPAGRRI